MARATAELISAELRYPDGTPVVCVIPDSCIGGVVEATEAADLFRREGVGVSITVTPCWCYGSETMDMDPFTPKAVWGLNGTERPGAVYLAAVLAGHSQKGLPAFGIYGHDVQDAGDSSIPPDVADKLLRFGRAGLAVAILHGKSYLSLGGVSMGIAGSIVDQSFFERYLGMRVESVDMSELTRRMDEGIYDPDEFARLANWGANHGAISYGHVGADLISVASLLRIPVSMHNVAPEQIFRPSAWTSLGTADPEGADFRACANFGPLYGRRLSG
jgi:L-fucose isomerase